MSLTTCKALSTLSQKTETVLSQKSETVAEFGESHFSATVSLLCDSLTFLRQCGQGLMHHVISTMMSTCRLQPFTILWHNYHLLHR